MITLTAKINLLSGDNSALSLGSTNLSGNNISSNLSSIVGVKKQGSNPFILGASKLGDGSTFSGKVDYFIGDRPSIEKEISGVGVFDPAYEINISNNKNDLKSITFAFDKINNRHPYKLNISYYNEKTSETKGVVQTEEYSYDWSGTTNTITGSVDFSNVPSNSTITSVTVNKSGNANITISKTENGYKYTIKPLSEEGSITYSFNISYTQKTSEMTLLEEKEYFDDDAIFTISNIIEGANYLSVKIDNWNAPNFPIVITGIYAEVSIEINYKNLISISRSIFDRSDLKLPSFGIISNTGSIEFNDVDGEIKDYAEQLLLQSGLKCEIKLNNTLVSGASQTIAVMETEEWDYDNDNRVVSVSLKDDLEEWQDINIVGIEYDPTKIEHQPFSFFYRRLWAVTNDKYPMQNLEQLDPDTKTILENTYTQYPLLESGSLWEQWTKLCEVCQLHIYKENGLVICRYNGGN